MADDIKTGQAEANAKAMREETRESRKLQQAITTTTNLLNKQAGVIGKVTRGFKSFLGVQTDVTENLESMGDVTQTTTDKIVEMTLKGRKGAIGMQVEVRRLVEETHNLARKNKEAADMLENHSKEYKVLGEQMQKVEKTMADIQDAEKKGAITKAEATKRIAEQVAKQEELRGKMTNVSHVIDGQAKTYHNLNMALLYNQKRLINSVKEMRAAKQEANAMMREMMRAKGIFGNIAAEMHAYGEGKMLKWMDSTAWVEKFKEAGKSAAKVYEMVAEVQNRNLLLSMQYGRTMEKGEDTLAGAAKITQQNQIQMRETALRLRMSYQEVEEIQKGIQARRLGMFGGGDIAENERMLTDTLAEFVRATGVDAPTALDAMQRRMESTGMSAREANADFMQTVTILKQMQDGAHQSNIAMDEMIKLIEHASSASESYVVDTRLMTQAMRAAATEAERMGASKKMAMKAAEAAGKMAGGGADSSTSVQAYVVMQKIIEDMKKDITPYVKNMNAAQKKYIQGIIDGVKQGGSIHDAIPLIEKAMGGTEKVLTAKFERLVKVYGRSPVKWGQIASELNMDPTSARIWYEQMDKATANQKRMNFELKRHGKEVQEMPLDELMSSQYDAVAEALRDMTNKKKTEAEMLERLQKQFHLTQEEAKKFLDIGKRTDLDVDAKEMERRLILSPSLKLKRVSDKVLAMFKGKKTKEEKEEAKKSVTEELKKEYGVSDDNKEALKDINDVSEKIAMGNEDIKDSMEHLAKVANVQLTQDQRDKLEAKELSDKILAAVAGVIPEDLKNILIALSTSAGMATISAVASAVLAFISLKYGGAKMLKNLPGMPGMGGAATGAGTAAKAAAGSQAGMVVDTVAKEALESGAKQVAEKAAEAGAKNAAEAGVKKVAEEAAEVGAKEAAESVAEAGAKKVTEEVAEAGAKKVAGEVAEAGAKKVAGEVAKDAAKEAVKGTAKGFAKKALGGTIGFAIEGASAYLENKAIDEREDLNEAEKSKRKTKNWIKAAGSGIGGILGGLGGTFVGGPVGTFVGGAAGSMAGGALAEKIADWTLGEDAEPGQKKDISAAKKQGQTDIAASQEMRARMNDQKSMDKTIEYLKIISDNTGQFASYAEELQRSRITQGAKSAGGAFTDSATGRSLTTYKRTDVAGAALDESGRRPSLSGDKDKGSSTETSAMTETTSYNEAEDSVNVKFMGLAAFIGMLKQKEAKVAR
jgi:hypothetical protein